MRHSTLHSHVKVLLDRWSSTLVSVQSVCVCVLPSVTPLFACRPPTCSTLFSAWFCTASSSWGVFGTPRAVRSVFAFVFALTSALFLLLLSGVAGWCWCGCFSCCGGLFLGPLRLFPSPFHHLLGDVGVRRGSSLPDGRARSLLLIWVGRFTGSLQVLKSLNGSK